MVLASSCRWSHMAVQKGKRSKTLYALSFFWLLIYSQWGSRNTWQISLILIAVSLIRRQKKLTQLLIFQLCYISTYSVQMRLRTRYFSFWGITSWSLEEQSAQ
jgi:hypothetical protein